jgi:hypothetical protein
MDNPEALRLIGNWFTKGPAAANADLKRDRN